MSDFERNKNEREMTGQKVLGKEPLRPPLPKRFYKVVDVEQVSDTPGQTPGNRSCPIEHRTQSVTGGVRPGGSDTVQPVYQILLDGRVIKTPKKRVLAVPALALAEAVAAEWVAQDKVIDPATMPLTRIANTALDAVAEHMTEVAADIAAFAGSDLVCYRAAAPHDLAQRQAAAWNPLLEWARHELGLRLNVGFGVVHVTQPEETPSRVLIQIGQLDAFRLAALHVMTTLTGSAVLAFACARGRISAEQAWHVAHIDEDWQIEMWGEDQEARDRRAFRLDEFQSASHLFALVTDAAVPGMCGPQARHNC